MVSPQPDRSGAHAARAARSHDNKLSKKLRFAGCAFMLPGCSRHPACDVSLLYWTDFTCASERGHAETFPKRFDAARVPEGEHFTPMKTVMYNK